MAYPYKTIQITNDTVDGNVNSHPQGKSYVYNGKLYTDFKISATHWDEEQEMWRSIVELSDNSHTETLIFDNITDPSAFGVGCGAVGRDDVNEYAAYGYIKGPATYEINSQVFKYRALGSTGAWTEKTMPLIEGIQAWWFHSLTIGKDGLIVIGYEMYPTHSTTPFTGGTNLGFVTTDDLGDTWTVHQIYDELIKNDLVEPTCIYDAEHDKYVGFLRSNDPSVDEPEFFVSTDLTSFTVTSMIPTTMFKQDNIQYPIIKGNNGVYYSVAVERVADTTTQKIYVITADSADAVANGWSAWTVTEQRTFVGGNQSSNNNTGVQSLSFNDSKLYCTFSINDVTLANLANVFVDIVTVEDVVKFYTSIDSTPELVWSAYDGKVFSQDGINYFRGVVDGDAVSVTAIGLTAY